MGTQDKKPLNKGAQDYMDELSSTPKWMDVTQKAKDVTYIYRVLARYNRFNFVQRILDPQESIIMPDTGRPGTHFMVWGESDGRYYVYPRIVMGVEGKLELLDETQAWEHAKKTGEMIPFSNKKEAEWFSYHYKDIWRGKFQEDGKSKFKY